MGRQSAMERVLASLRPLQQRSEITAWVELEAQEAVFEEFPPGVSDDLKDALGNRGIRRLYSHQAAAFTSVARGRNIVIITPTASGKTLCYNLPVLNRMSRDPDARALYLFPTKALAQDQMAELQHLIDSVGATIGVHTYDGDTPADTRRSIRREGRIILTNPDMLHTALMPHHPKWIELFQNLQYVIVDEMHSYRGVFGSHVANVFRRLKRIAHFYGSSPQFICTSATLANPRELAVNLLGEEVELIEKNGAPRAAKHLIFYNPPIINRQLGLRKGALSSARRFAHRFLGSRIQTLVFASSRVNVEVLLSYLKKAFEKHPAAPVKIRGYRGGYLPRTRREIERQLRNRELLGVVSTNALELGIDIGSLEAVILAGYPGTIASTWQQIGRAGRRTGRSAAILVARNLPLDQFIVNHPEYFLERSPENGLVEPDNLQILLGHVKCAAFELPFEKGEWFGGENLEEILDFLAEKGTLCRTGDSWHWSEEAYPANAVSLRNIAEENFVVFNTHDDNKAIAEVDFDSAPELIHEDAIYMCEGRQYHVDRLDYDGRKAYVRPVKVDYYTDAMTYSGLKVLRVDDGRQQGRQKIEHGEIHVYKKYPGFKKIKFYSLENLGYGKIHLPNHELHTTSYWFTAPESFLQESGLSRRQLIQGFLGVSYAMHHVATLLLMCDVRDLGRSVGDRSALWFAQAGPEGLGFYSSAAEPNFLNPDQLQRFDPTIFLYDNLPGGIGFSGKLFECHDRLLNQTEGLIQACGCRSGCPSCIGPVDELTAGGKEASLAILRLFRSPVPVH